MIYNLEERATLFDGGKKTAEGRLRDMIALALTWGEERFGTIRIETVTQEVYERGGIVEIATAEGITAEGDQDQ